MFYPGPERVINQGSYAMHTLIQHPSWEYDIDVALIFDKDALPAQALDARKRIADALARAGGRLKYEPQARTNAATVWYADGTHVDFAIYRRFTSWRGAVLEHAGPDWGMRDPDTITAWFNAEVARLSPQFFSPDVESKQLRRIVQLVKMHVRAHDSNAKPLPGGLILTALAVECYSKDRNRDDQSFYETLHAIRSRLSRRKEVICPGSSEALLTGKPKSMAQVKRLAILLERSLHSLSRIEKPDCSRRHAMQAWGGVFKHQFWQEQLDTERRSRVAKS